MPNERRTVKIVAVVEVEAQPPNPLPNMPEDDDVEIRVADAISNYAAVWTNNWRIANVTTMSPEVARQSYAEFASPGREFDAVDQLDDDIRWSEIRLALEAAGDCLPIMQPQHLREWLGRYVVHKDGRNGDYYVTHHSDGKLCVHPRGNPKDTELWETSDAIVSSG